MDQLGGFLESELERALAARGEAQSDDKVVPISAAIRAVSTLNERERRFRELLNALPAAVYTTDAAGRLTYYNDAAAELWGHRPQLGTSEWCGSWKLFWADGTPLPHGECPMAIALKENRAVRGMEAACERPDGTRVPFIPYLSAQLAVSLGMAIHELTINAAKYGSLSAMGGKIAVTWSVTIEATRRRLDFDWVESGGPPVSSPKRQGFGVRLLEYVLPGQIQAKATIDYRPEGVQMRCSVPMPLDGHR